MWMVIHPLFESDSVMWFTSAICTAWPGPLMQRGVLTWEKVWNWNSSRPDCNLVGVKIWGGGSNVVHNATSLRKQLRKVSGARPRGVPVEKVTEQQWDRCRCIWLILIRWSMLLHLFIIWRDFFFFIGFILVASVLRPFHFWFIVKIQPGEWVVNAVTGSIISIPETHLLVYILLHWQQTSQLLGSIHWNTTKFGGISSPNTLAFCSALCFRSLVGEFSQ